MCSHLKFFAGDKCERPSVSHRDEVRHRANPEQVSHCPKKKINYNLFSKRIIEGLKGRGKDEHCGLIFSPSPAQNVSDPGQKLRGRYSGESSSLPPFYLPPPSMSHRLTISRLTFNLSLQVGSLDTILQVVLKLVVIPTLNGEHFHIHSAHFSKRYAGLFNDLWAA